eukprot:TRINITY_DN1617_c2_g2_i1.p1 TRINITY_DN1617_c2_g2~~TRINITY_DN1617_c2_g2_i1.p1  ORF type:complete len:648 (+),score=96.16 TRINITY_DN1617_c2_g2_i1:25-1968(+)
MNYHCIFWTISLFKMLFMPLYRSTDFEVHRNWLAITHSLPIDRWYYENTSEWTLDYPPFFAWFEYGLGYVANWFDPEMLVVSNLNYASTATIIFQRLSVIVTDAILYFAIIMFCRSDRETVLDTYEDADAEKEGEATVDIRHDDNNWNNNTNNNTTANKQPAMKKRFSSPNIEAIVDDDDKRKQRAQERARNLLYVLLLTFANPGLLIVDHIHFQYNGFLLGVFVWSLALIRKGDDLMGAMLFAILLNLKHIFLYVAPPFGIYLLCHYCFVSEPAFQTWDEFEENANNAKRYFHWGRFFRLSFVVLMVFTVSFGPFVLYGQLKQVLLRLFPVQRGLCHAYWAPNVWSLYNCVDRILVQLKRFASMGSTAATTANATLSAAAGGGGGGGAVLSLVANLTSLVIPSSSSSSLSLSSSSAAVAALKLLTNSTAATPSMTAGLVADIHHVILPTITFRLTGVLSLLTMLPACYQLWKTPHPKVFIYAVIYCTMCSFMLGYHVHEKAILMVTIPLSLCALSSYQASHLFMFMLPVAHYSLFPLLFKPTEIPIKIAITLLHFLIACELINDARLSIQIATRIRRGRIFNWFLKGYLTMMVVLFIYCQFIHPWLLPRLEFLPLLLTSVYCSFGMLYSWFCCYRLLLREVSLQTE